MEVLATVSPRIETNIKSWRILATRRSQTDKSSALPMDLHHELTVHGEVDLEDSEDARVNALGDIEAVFIPVGGTTVGSISVCLAMPLGEGRLLSQAFNRARVPLLVYSLE